MRLIVAEDSALLREGLRRILSARGAQVVAEAATGEELAALTSEHRPDAVLVDLRMPPTYTDEGMNAVAAVRRDFPSIATLLLSQYAEVAIAERLLTLGDHHTGYLLKDRVTDPDHLYGAIERVCAGEIVLDPELVRGMLNRPRLSSALDTLTDRERDVLALLAEGRSNAGIADLLFLSIKTVERYVAQVFGKLQLSEEPETNRRVLAAIAYLRAES